MQFDTKIAIVIRTDLEAWQKLNVASFLAGGIFLCWADTLARVILAPVELPVGVVTAFLGGPFFFYLLHHEGKKYAL